MKPLPSLFCLLLLVASLACVSDTSAPSPQGSPIAGNLPLPTLNPRNSGWVEERLDAVIRLYQITDAGVALVRSLDVRQMRGEPGYFGSFGFKKWAGVGEAMPIGVIHELGHSYWGGFPVEGFAELSWDILSGEKLSPALQRYHDDALAFMAQPPDDYELLRQRLRNLPALSSENPEPLIHTLEGDLVYNTGGHLALVPPILRKYWIRFMREGPFGSWYDAAAWYQSLAEEDRAAANKYLGFQHLDLRRYTSLGASDVGTGLVQASLEILDQEERQRLYDLADQFDLLLGDAQKEEKFRFWRDYLRDKQKLHRQHPEFLASLSLPRAKDLAVALDVMNGLLGLSPGEQASRLARQLPSQPFLVNFLPVLDNRTLLELFGAGTQLPQGVTLQATASFVERLNRFSVVVDRVLALGRGDPHQGAAELQQFLDGVPVEPVDDLRLFLEFFGDADRETAKAVVLALDNETVRRLMEPLPTHLRDLLTPDDLLAKLDLTVEAGFSRLKRGITLLVEEPAGNFKSNELFLGRMYQVMAERSSEAAQDTFRVVQETPFPLEGFIQQQPQAAVVILDSDLAAAAHLVRGSDPVLFPPARVIYRLIYADSKFAARLTLALADLGEEALVVESLAYFAYDQHRLERVSGLPISLERDGQFLEALLVQRGEEWLTQRLSTAFADFGGRAARGEVSPDFLAQYRATLEAAVASLPGPDSRGKLQTIIERVAAGLDTGR